MRFINSLLVFLCSLAVPSVALASTPALTRTDVEAWLDGLLPYALQHGDVAGGVVVVVKDGEVLLQKGYGYADVASKRPVDPERTLFRAGSVAKLVTATAVMQLVEQGKVDLDADIETYLDCEIPDAFGKPVTLRNLITHTGGFEELVRQLMSSDPQAFEQSLEAYVKKTHPTRIFPPGEVPSYCNYCLALAGHIIQRVSGEPFDDYLDRHIFEPLGMQRSTFRQPLPAKFTADMSSGYNRGTDPASYYELVGPTPAGSLATTGADMARFMIAHLQAETAAVTLLQPQTARLMHNSLFKATPPVNGMALGFFEGDRNGQRVLEHGGDTQFFHSQLALFMDQRVGLFMSFNSVGKEGAVGSIRSALFEEFADRYFPAPMPDEPTAPTAVEHSRLVAGIYASSRRAETTFFATIALLGQFAVVANADGTLVIPPLTGPQGRPKVWREVAPFVWREVGGKERLAARIENGRVRFLGHDSSSGIQVFTPVPVGKSSGWIIPVMLAAISSLLLTAIAWPVSALIRRRYGAAFALTGQQALGFRLVRATAIVDLAFLLGWALLIQTGLANLAVFGGGADGWFWLLHLSGLLGAVGAAVAIWNAWLVLKGNDRWWSKAWNIVLAASCVAITWFAFTFNLVNFSVRY
jgi:CubicO group peptidase (beta-lactamase class C family)